MTTFRSEVPLLQPDEKSTIISQQNAHSHLHIHNYMKAVELLHL